MLHLRHAAAVYRLLRNLPLGFISFVMGAFLVTRAFAATGIGGAALMLLLWVIFGHFWEHHLALEPWLHASIGIMMNCLGSYSSRASCSWDLCGLRMKHFQTT